MFTPKSLRLIVALAEKPTVSFPPMNAGVVPAPAKPASSVTGFVTPLSVRFPAILAVVPLTVTEVETNRASAGDSRPEEVRLAAILASAKQMRCQCRIGSRHPGNRHSDIHFRGTWVLWIQNKRTRDVAENAEIVVEAKMVDAPPHKRVIGIGLVSARSNARSIGRTRGLHGTAAWARSGTARINGNAKRIFFTGAGS